MFATLEEAEELVDKVNANLEPELLSAADARRALEIWTRIERKWSFGIAALARKVADTSELALATGTSMGRAKEMAATGKVLGESAELSEALKHGEISYDQAAEIAKAEESAPGVAKQLISVAQKESFQVLKDKTRKGQARGRAASWPRRAAAFGPHRAELRRSPRHGQH